MDSDLLILSVVARKGNVFASYDLLQTISAAGLQFGDKNIFHYYEMFENNKNSLFSLASMTESGDFDLSRIGNFSCSGLVLFMHMSKVANPQKVFELMFTTAERLADDLDGELRADPKTPWNDEIAKCYQLKIDQYLERV